MRIAAIPTVLAILATTALHAEEGKLQRAKAEVHRPPSASSSSSQPVGSGSSSTRSGTYASDDDDDDGALLGFVFEMVVIPIAACFHWPADDQGPAAVVGVERYPYHDDWNGYFAPYGANRKGRISGGEAYAEYGFIDSDIDRYAVGGRVFLSALALRTEWNRYLEHRPGGGSDSLTLGTIDLELGVPIGPYARIGLGVGSTIIHDRISTESGLCGVISADIFPLKPLVLHGVFTYGTVSDGEFDPETDIMTLRATLGAVWNRVEVYAGWQATWIESVQLDGPAAGLRVWF